VWEETNGGTGRNGLKSESKGKKWEITSKIICYWPFLFYNSCGLPLLAFVVRVFGIHIILT